jgi:hypothetical protein
MGNITISTARTKAYAKEQRTMNNERCSKQTQSNPIHSPRLELCSTLSEVEGLPAPLSLHLYAPSYHGIMALLRKTNPILQTTKLPQHLMPHRFTAISRSAPPPKNKPKQSQSPAFFRVPACAQENSSNCPPNAHVFFKSYLSTGESPAESGRHLAARPGLLLKQLAAGCADPLGYTVKLI